MTHVWVEFTEITAAFLRVGVSFSPLSCLISESVSTQDLGFGWKRCCLRLSLGLSAILLSLPHLVSCNHSTITVKICLNIDLKQNKCWLQLCFLTPPSSRITWWWDNNRFSYLTFKSFILLYSNFWIICEKEVLRLYLHLALHVVRGGLMSVGQFDPEDMGQDGCLSSLFVKTFFTLCSDSSGLASLFCNVELLWKHALRHGITIHPIIWNQ